MLNTMKTVTTREFYHTPALIKSLRAGQSVVVTDKGSPSFIVTKAGKRLRKSREDLEREAMEICPEDRPKVNFTQAIRELKDR